MTVRSAIQTQTKSFCRWLRRPTDDDPREVLRRFKAILRQCMDDGERDFVMAATDKDSPGVDPIAEINTWAAKVRERLAAHEGRGRIKRAAGEVLKDHIQKTFGRDDEQAKLFFNRVCKRAYDLEQKREKPLRRKVTSNWSQSEIRVGRTPWPHEHVAPKLDATK